MTAWQLEKAAVDTIQVMDPDHISHMAEGFWLSIGVLLFATLVLGAEVYVIIKKNQGWGRRSTQIVGLTLILLLGTFLITAGYSRDQITPMIGLLGTIAGYLLGNPDVLTRES